MARTGNFGTRIRAVPSLTNTLLAIAREQQSREDQNMMDAWQKGGLVKGHKVTDSVILAYWHKRLDGVSKDDPLYDTYKNAIMQYDYSIHESKMTAKYALIAKPGAGDDSAMASFYLNWAKKVPKDSEFYRVLQRDAGQYLRSAAAKRRASTQESEEKKYRANLDAIEKKYENPGQLALQYVTMLAQRGSQGRGAILGETPLGVSRDIAGNTNLADLQLPAVDEMIALLATVNPHRPLSGVSLDVGSNNVLFHDEAGNPVTGKDIIDSLRKADPSFDGHFTVQSLGKMIATQKEGLQKRIDLAKKTGHASDAANLSIHLARVNEYGNELNAWPVLAQYSDLKAEQKRIMEDNTLLPAAKVAAIDRINASIGRLSDDPRIAADDHLKSQLRGEAEGVAGTVTAYEDMEGLKSGFSTAQDASNSEVMNMTAMRTMLQDQIDLTLDPESGFVMTQGDYVKDPTAPGGVRFQPSPGGKAVGAAPQSDIANLPSAGAAVTVMVPNGDGGGATPMVLVPAPVMATAKKPDGTTIGMANKNPVASFVKFTVNGVETTVFGLTDKATGVTRWTTDPPWDTSKVKMQETNSGLTLDLSAVVPTTDTTGREGGDMGNGFSVVGKHGPGRGGAAKPGALVMDPAAAALGTQPERQAAGFDPFSDSFSPTLIALKSTPDGQALLKQYASNDSFKKIIDDDAHRASGMTYDVNTGIWNGNAQQTQAYGKFQQQASADLDHAKNGMNLPGSSLGERDDAWERAHTNTQTLGAGTSLGGSFGEPLPSDVLRSDNRFGSMANAFKPGSTQFAPAKPLDRGGLVLNQPLKLTVPGFTTPMPTAAPAPTIAPVSTNVQPMSGFSTANPAVPAVSTTQQSYIKKMERSGAQEY